MDQLRPVERLPQTEVEQLHAEVDNLRDEIARLHYASCPLPDVAPYEPASAFREAPVTSHRSDPMVAVPGGKERGRPRGWGLVAFSG